MPYDNLPESQWAEMDKCVEEVMAEGKDKEAAIAICFASISGKSAYIREHADIVYCGDSVKALGDGRVGGYLVRYSSPKDPDLVQDYFDKDTTLRYPDSLPVLYAHGSDKKMQDRVIGNASVKADDAGLWIEAQLEMRDEYEKQIYKLAEKGKLGWSSGAISHLVKREPVGKAYHIKSWWIGEASLTPTPAEYRNTVTTIKSLLEMPEGKEEKKTMDEKDITQTVNDAVKSALAIRDAEIKAEQDRQAAIKSAEEAGYNKAIEELKSRKAPAFNQITEPGFSEEKDAVPAFKHWIKTGQVNQALITPDSSFEIKAAFNQTSGASGGYLVPDPLYNQIIAKRNLASWVRQLPVQMFQTQSDHLLVPVEDTSHTAFVLTAESAGYNENEGTVAQKDLILYKYTKEVRATEEFLAHQGTNFDSWLANALARAEAVTENTAFTTGNGSGQPQGVVTGATVANTTATTDIILPAELAAFFGYLGAGYNVRSECGLLMNNATKWYLAGQTGNPFLYTMTPPAAGNILDENIMGYKLVVDDDVVTYTTASSKCIVFGNFNYYGVVEKPGMVVQRNPYLYMANGQIGIFANIFRGGAVLQGEAFYYLTNHS